MKQMTMLMMGCSGSALTARMIPGDLFVIKHSLFGVTGIPVILNQIKVKHQSTFGVIGGILEENTLKIKHQSLYAVVGV